MIAKQCDRCGAFYKHYGTQDIKKEGLKFNGVTTMVFAMNGDNVIRGNSYDLCKQCSRSLQKFLSNETEIINCDVTSATVESIIGDDADALPSV